MLAVAAYVRPNPMNANLHCGLEFWDFPTGKLLRRLKDLSSDINESVRTMAFSRDGNLLAVGFPNHIFLFDTATEKEVCHLDLEVAGAWDPCGLAFTPDAKKLVAAGSYGMSRPIIYVWEIATGKVLRTFKGRRLFGGSFALSPDGKRVALSSFYGNTVQLWDMAAGKELSLPHRGHDTKINSLAYSPDGKTLVSAGEFGPLILWDTVSKEQKGVLPGTARCLSFSPNGKQLVTVAEDLNSEEEITKNRVRVWDVRGGKETVVITVPDAENVGSARFSPNGRRLFTLDFKENEGDFCEYCVHHWDAASGKLLAKLPPKKDWRPSHLQDASSLLAMYDGVDMGVYDGMSGQKTLERKIQGQWFAPLAPYYDFRVLAAGVTREIPTPNPDSSQWSNSDIGLWDLLTGKEIFLLKGHQGHVAVIAWSNDGRLLASGDGNAMFPEPKPAQTVRVWDMATGKELARFGGIKGNVTALTFSPDGRNLAAGLANSAILMWDILAPPLKPDWNELASRWNDLAGGDAGKAHRALLSLIGAPESVPFLRHHLKPVARADASKIQQWLADLDSEEFTIRQAAAKDLEKTGSQVQPFVQKALKGNLTLEARRRLEQILKNLSDVPGSETLRIIRAIMVLERIGSPEAQSVLGTLAGGAPGVRETEEARASLERLIQRAAQLP